jgi:hypothetical protein
MIAVGGSGSVDHIEGVRQQAFHHGRGAGSVVGAIAVDKNVSLRFDVREHAAHDVAFALMSLGADDGAGLRGVLARGVARVVVVDVDHRLGQGSGEVAHDASDRRSFVVARDEHGDARIQGATLLNTYSLDPR